jgi:hypothetical protein
LRQGGEVVSMILHLRDDLVQLTISGLAIIEKCIDQCIFIDGDGAIEQTRLPTAKNALNFIAKL